ncbi:MAG: helicase HerA domain-containing protein, partial [Thermoplasmata archaeon]
MQDSGYEVGYTIGNSRSDYFSFVMSPDSGIMKWEYVNIEINGEIILGRIEDLISKSDLLTDHLDYNSIRRYTDTGINDAVDVCEVRILGIPADGGIKRSRYLIRPGIPVKRATKEILEKLFRVDDEKALNIGYLTDNPDIEVSADIDGLRRHLAIIAQTGAGKSHTAGVIMEEILKKGGSIVVIDPHADYVLMKNSSNPLYKERIKIFRTPLSTGRYMDRLGKVTDFTIRFQDLNPDEVSEIMGIKENYTNLSKIVRDSFEKMSAARDVDEFINRAEKVDSEGKISARIKYLKRIRQIFGPRSTDVSEFLAPSQLSVIDLSGLDQSLANYFAYRVISQSYDMKTSSAFEYPVFIFIEEAHNFVPAAKNKPGGVSGLVFDQIRKIASEGRKFGIFLAVITQRPGKIDQDVLSQ